MKIGPNWDSADAWAEMADEGDVSYLGLIADLVSTLQQARQTVSTVSVRADTGGSRSEMRGLLQRALAGCGCGALLFTETETRLNLCFDVPAEEAAVVYWRLVEAGMEFDGESHRELTRLCTVQSHSAEIFFLERPCTMRLELRFRGERRRGAVLPAAGVA